MTQSGTALRLGISNTPNATQKRDLLRLMDYLDGIREEFGEPIKVTSGFRSWRVNKDVGGVKNSQHLAGQAADIVPAKSPERLRELFDIIRKRGGFQQVIYERKGQSVWVHVAIPPLGEMPKQEAMTTNDGKNFTRLK
nr:MAG TPA: peptidase [Caudoviricetes sp.]